MPQTSYFREGKEMKVTIYPDRCKGCGLCEGIAPSVFRVDDYNQAQVVIQPDPLTPDVQEAIARCPMDAIALLAE